MPLATVLRYAVFAFCVLVCAVGAVGFAFPTQLWRRLRSLWQQPFAMVLAVGSRLLLGTTLILFAPDSRFPLVFRLVGLLGLVAAVGLCLVGWKRIDGLMRWVGERPSPLIRTASVLGMVVGAILFYGAI